MVLQLDDAVSAFLVEYPAFSRKVQGDGSVWLDGPFFMDAEYDDIRLAESFRLRIAVPRAFPQDMPRVKELSQIISRNYEHLYSDATFCLGVDGEMAMFLVDNPSLVSFLRGPVTSFLYSAVFHKRYGRYPFGDRPHGALGVVEYYKELFGVEDGVAAMSLLACVCRGGFRNLEPCSCGSGFSLRKCHGKQLEELAASPVLRWLKRDYAIALQERRQ